MLEEMSSESGETGKQITWWLKELPKLNVDGVLGGRSYHDGEHYNSVRRQDDIGLGPAKSIIIEVMLNFFYVIDTSPWLA
jgi:hypothetical protein